MPVLRPILLAFVLACAHAHAAALVPLSTLKPVGSLEPNRGQAKPEILFLSRGFPGVAVTAQSILFSPPGARQDFVASNPNPAVRFADPLPGVLNSFTGADAQKWVTGIPRYATAHLTEIYAGIDAEYTRAANAPLSLKLLFRPGINPKLVVCEIQKAVSIVRNSDGSLRVRLGSINGDPELFYVAPLAFQDTASGPVSRSVRFEVLSTTRFGFEVQDQDSTLPLQIELKLGAPGRVFNERHRTVDAAGNIFVAVTIPDAAGKDAPFPGRWDGCTLLSALACTDVAVYKYSKAGELIFVSYIAGKNQEAVHFLGIAADGTLVIAGDTDSADFPVTPAALQPAYAGPEARLNVSSGSPILGDFFAVKLDAATGMLRASTFLGGPNGDSGGTGKVKAAIGMQLRHARARQVGAVQQPVESGAEARRITG